MFGIVNLGLVLLSLKKNKKAGKFLPSFNNVLEVKHHIKGRLRLKVHTLYYNDEAISHLDRNLKKLKEIKEVSLDKRSSSVIIKYNEDELDPVIIISVILKVLKLEEQIDSSTNSFLIEKLSSIKDSLNLTIHEKTNGLLNLESLLLIVFFTTGIYKLAKKPRVFPGGVTLLWWSYQIISKNRKKSKWVKEKNAL